MSDTTNALKQAKEQIEQTMLVKLAAELAADKAVAEIRQTATQLALDGLRGQAEIERLKLLAGVRKELLAQLSDVADIPAAARRLQSKIDSLEVELGIVEEPRQIETVPEKPARKLPRDEAGKFARAGLAISNGTHSGEGGAA